MKILYILLTVSLLASCAGHPTEAPCPGVKASHILTQASTPEEFRQAYDTANVILAKLQKGESFEALALQYGSDGTKTKGGDLGWFTRGMMVQPFEDSCFNAVINKPLIVETKFGVHVINVNAKNEAPCK